ncbi:hypothetical protein EG329_006663 [Mollisiaceae sp. DMI_Dod_QoI]|nr:hypothetical protein EG329_006663 [Helotiales sp. DMI_Dod_QoI]
MPPKQRDNGKANRAAAVYRSKMRLQETDEWKQASPADRVRLEAADKANVWAARGGSSGSGSGPAHPNLPGAAVAVAVGGAGPAAAAPVGFGGFGSVPPHLLHASHASPARSAAPADDDDNDEEEDDEEKDEEKDEDGDGDEGRSLLHYLLYLPQSHADYNFVLEEARREIRGSCPAWLDPALAVEDALERLRCERPEGQ